MNRTGRGLLAVLLLGFLDTAVGVTNDVARLQVDGYRFTGNTVFTAAELNTALTNFSHRGLTAVELEAARRTVTMHYVKAGYVNSGCLLDPQAVTNGIVSLRVIEGRLTELNVSGAKWLRQGFIKPRIAAGAGQPLNLQRLQENMLMLRQLPFIDSLKAELHPGGAKGEGVLDVRVEEARLAHLTIAAHNQRPPSVGAEGMEAQLAVENPTGWGDHLGLSYGLLQRDEKGVRFPGVDNLGLRYSVPLNPQDTTLALRYDRRNFGVVEEPFNALNVEAIAEFWSAELRQPLRKSLTEELGVSMTADLRTSRTLLNGSPFNLAAGAVNGETRVSVVRCSADYLRRSRRQVFASRLTLSVGAGWLNATDDGTDRDAHFASLAGQTQYLRELNDEGFKLIASGAFQWANSPLLSLEQFSLGGAGSIRGYRENTVVRDTGVRGSIELRLPVMMPGLQEPLRPETLQLAPFVDCGASWNVRAPTTGTILLPSAGIGLLWAPNDRFSSRVVWGHAFRRPANQSGDLQDHGIHFSLAFRAF